MQTGRNESQVDREISRVLSAPDVRTWVKAALQAALEKDPIDAAQDAALLSHLPSRRAGQILQEGRGR